MSAGRKATRRWGVSRPPGSRLTLLDVDDSRWIDFAQRSDAATFFHHPAWVRLVADCYGFEARVAAIVDEETHGVTAGVPMVELRGRLRRPRWLALPFTDYCPPLGDEEARAALAHAIATDAALGGVGAVEVRGEMPRVAGFASSVTAVRHAIALSADSGEVYARFSAMHQRNIRKAIRAGVRVERGDSRNDLETFYQLHLRTRRRHGVPIQPRRFFDLLQTRVITPGHGFVLTARLNETPLASAVFVSWNGVLMYKYGASDERFWEHRANNLVLWSAIKWGCETGSRSFDLGRSDLADAGLRSFKDGFGAIEKPVLHTGTRLSASDRARPVVRRALSILIRRSHPWLSQALGELLYRYAA